MISEKPKNLNDWPIANLKGKIHPCPSWGAEVIVEVTFFQNKIMTKKKLKLCLTGMRTAGVENYGKKPPTPLILGFYCIFGALKNHSILPFFRFPGYVTKISVFGKIPVKRMENSKDLC